MSLISALDESDKTSSHGWSNANRYGTDIQQGTPQLNQQQFKPQQQQKQCQQQSPRQQHQRQQQQRHQQQIQQQQQWSQQGGDHNLYNHLISQNNRGGVPEAVVEEEIVGAETFSSVATNQYQTSTNAMVASASQTNTVHHMNPRNQVAVANSRTQQPMVIVSVTQPGVPQISRGITQSQACVRQSREPQVKTYQQQGQYIQTAQGNQPIQTLSQGPRNDLPNQQYQQGMVQIQQPLQQGQLLEIPDNPQAIDEELAYNEKKIEENKRKLLMYQQMGINVSQMQQNINLQQLQTTGINQTGIIPQAQGVKLINYNKAQTPVQQRGHTLTPNSSGLVGIDYVGSLHLQNSGNSVQQNNAVRTILFNSSQNKVDVKFVENSSAPIRAAQEKPQVITLSNNRPKMCVQTSPGQTHFQSNNFQNVAQQNIQSNRVNNPSTNNLSQTVSANQTTGSQTNDSLSECTVIEGARVELKGGGKFEEGQIYVVKNKSGQEKKMIWTGKELMEMRQDTYPVLLGTSSQTGHGRGRGQTRGRGGRGRGHLQGNATGVHMSQHGGGQPPLMNSSPGRNMSSACHTSPVQSSRIRTPSHMISSGQGPTIRTPTHIIRPVRAQTSVHQQTSQLRPQGQLQKKVQGVMPTGSVRPVGSPPVIRQPLIINTSGLMPPAQGSQKMASGSNTNLARKAVESKASATESIEKKAEDQSVEQSEQVDIQGGGDARSQEKGVDSNDDLPQQMVDDPELVAVCQFCGISSQNKLKCERCQRKFNNNTKYYYKSDPEAKRRKVEPPAQQDGATKTESALTKKSFYGQKLAEQNQVYAKMLNLNGPGITVRGIKRSLRPIPEARGRGRSHRGNGRIRGMHVPETVTISSDEEEDCGSESSSKPATPKPQPQSQLTSDVPPSTPSQSSNNSTEPLESPLIPTIPISSKVDNKPRVDKMEDEKGISKKGQREKSPTPEKLTVLLMARTVRVGTFRGVPIEPIQLSDEGIDFYIEGVKEAHKFQVYPREIQQCLAKFGKGTCMLFFLTSRSAGERIRNNLGMQTHKDPTTPPPEPYFDMDSKDMCHQMIIVLLDSVDNKTVYEFGRVMEIFRKFGHVMDSSFYLELNAEEADEVLKQATQTTLSQQNNVVADHQYTFMEEGQHSPSPPKMGFVGPIIKLLTYPPPPATGGISITNEDLYCLQEGEFLNDVIIDFYLKFLLLEKLSAEDKKRTHIFSSFFWKRLTQRVRALDDDPTLSLPVKRHARVKTWTRHVDLFKKDFIIVPINEHAHWFLAIICYPGLEEACENPFIPKPHTAPPPPELAVPTPPQPRDDEEDMDMEEMESEDPLPEVPQDPAVSGDETKTGDIAEKTGSVDNSSNTNKVQSTEEVKGDQNNKNRLDKGDKGTSSAKKSDTSSDDAKQQTQESNSTEHSETTDKIQTSQSSEIDTQTEEMDTSEKKEDGVKPAPTPSSVSPATLLALTGKTDGKHLAGDRIIRGQSVAEETIKKDDLKKGIDFNVGVKQPCVIVFDSLLGPSRSRVVQVLKEYLMVEWSIKRGGTEYNKQLIKGTVPKVPQQTNYSDCGVFMLQYVESFFEDPIQDFVTPMKGLYDWFSLEKIEGKREELRDLIIGLKDRFENNTEPKENS